MSALTPLLLKGLTGPARRLVAPRAHIHSKPAREPFGALDVAIGLTSSFLCCLLPAGWVLSHLECYKELKE